MVENGWRVCESDPLKLTLEIPQGVSNVDLTERLRQNHVEYEYADPDYLVFMLTPENTEEDFRQLLYALGNNKRSYEKKAQFIVQKATQKTTIREAMFSTPEAISVKEAMGRICRVPTVSCPPAIPIAVPGEEVDARMLMLFEHYGIKEIDVIKNLD